MFLTLDRLYEIVKRHVAIDKYAHEKKVVIRLSEPSIGGISCVGITQAYGGIDWDNGKFIIQPAEPIIRKKQHERKESQDVTKIS